MNKNTYLTLNCTLGLVIVAMIVMGILSAKPAKAIPDTIGQWQLWNYQGRVSTAMDDIVDSPGASRCIVLDFATAAVADGESGTSFSVVSGTTHQEFEFFPSAAIGGPIEVIHQRLRIPANEGIDISAVGSGAEIFLTLEGHYENVY